MINKGQEYRHLFEFLNKKRGIEDLSSIHSHDLDAFIRLKRQRGLQTQSIITNAKQVKAFFN